MGKPIRIDEELYKAAEETGKAEYRTVPLQIQYWAKIGKIALENPDLPGEFIQDILLARSQRKQVEAFEFRNE